MPTSAFARFTRQRRAEQQKAKLRSAESTEDSVILQRLRNGVYDREQISFGGLLKVLRWRRKVRRQVVPAFPNEEDSPKTNESALMSTEDYKVYLQELEQSRARFALQQKRLSMAVVEAKDAYSSLHKWVEMMLEDFRILEHHEAWRASILAICEFANGVDVSPGQALPCIKAVGDEVLRQLQLAEPEVCGELGQASVLLTIHESSSGGSGGLGSSGGALQGHGASNDLIVISASSEASRQHQRAKPGAVWRSRSTNALSASAFHCFHSGQSTLCSRHGTDSNAVSLIPLRQRNHRVFGVLISGAPAVPNDMLEIMERVIGQTLERTWRRGKVNAMIRVAMNWIKHLSFQLTAVDWVEGEGTTDASHLARLINQNAAGTRSIGQGADGQSEHQRFQNGKCQWQPLGYHEGSDLRRFRLPLNWRDGVIIGVLLVTFADFEGTSVETLELLHAIAPMIEEGVRDIERMDVGEIGRIQLSDAFTAAHFEARRLLPRKLQMQMRQNLASLELGVIMAELKAYVGEHIDRKPGLVKLMRGVLALVGRNAKETKDWDAIKIQLKPSLVQEMLGIDVTDVSDEAKRRWADSEKAMAGVDLDELLHTAPKPLQSMAKLMMAVRLTQHVNLKIQSELETYSGQLGHWRSKAGASPPPGLRPAAPPPRRESRTSLRGRGLLASFKYSITLSEQLLTDEEFAHVDAIAGEV